MGAGRWVIGGEERPWDRITAIYIEKPSSRHDPFESVYINQSTTTAALWQGVLNTQRI